MIKYIKSIAYGLPFIIFGIMCITTKEYYSEKFNFIFNFGEYHTIIGIILLGLGLLSIIHEIRKILSNKEK